MVAVLRTCAQEQSEYSITVNSPFVASSSYYPLRMYYCVTYYYFLGSPRFVSPSLPSPPKRKKKNPPKESKKANVLYDSPHYIIVHKVGGAHEGGDPAGGWEPRGG